jgi:NADH-quinone oxidoreductase subunit I
MIREYFRDLYDTVKTILIGMKVTARYTFARSICVQYPTVAPTLQPRFRGFHIVDLTTCLGCNQCAVVCPVDCIYVERTGPRKMNKETGEAVGGAITRYAIDYSKCLFCALCTTACAPGCIEMGENHDMSGYDRRSMIVEFTELAKEGLMTPLPLWLEREPTPEWALERKRRWLERFGPHKERLARVLIDTTPPKKPKPAPKEAPAS